MNLNLLFLCLALLLILSGCKQSHRNSPKAVLLPSDTMPTSSYYFHPDSMVCAHYDVCCSGNSDSLFGEYPYCLSLMRVIHKDWLGRNDDWYEDMYPLLCHACFTFSVDTLREASIFMDEWRGDTLKKENLYKAYWLTIRNNSDSVIKIPVQDGSLMMIQEAKDKEGKWRPFEYWASSFCGNSYSSYVLPPDHFIATKALRYQGNFSTDIRLKLKLDSAIFYSPVFKGSIDTVLFAKPYYLNDNRSTWYDAFFTE